MTHYAGRHPLPIPDRFHSRPSHRWALATCSGQSRDCPADSTRPAAQQEGHASHTQLVHNNGRERSAISTFSLLVGFGTTATVPTKGGAINNAPQKPKQTCLIQEEAWLSVSVSSARLTICCMTTASLLWVATERGASSPSIKRMDAVAGPDSS